MKKAILHLALLAALSACCASAACARESLVKKYSLEYPPEIYIVGIGEVKLKGGQYAAYRVAEVHARKDIAQQISVHVDSKSVDYACSGSAGKAYPDAGQCRDEFVSVIKVSADEYLAGSRVVDKGIDGEYVFVVVVMPRKGVAEAVRQNLDESVKRTRELAGEAKAGDKAKSDEARREMLRALAYKGQLESMEGVRKNADEAFMELEREIGKLP